MPWLLPRLRVILRGSPSGPRLNWDFYEPSGIENERRNGLNNKGAQGSRRAEYPLFHSCTFEYRMWSGAMMFFCLQAVAFSSCPFFSVCTSMGAGTICGLYFWRILSFLEDTSSDVHIPSGMSSSGLLVG